LGVHGKACYKDKSIRLNIRLNTRQVFELCIEFTDHGTAHFPQPAISSIVLEDVACHKTVFYLSSSFLWMTMMIHHSQKQASEFRTSSREACPHVDRERFDLSPRCCEKGERSTSISSKKKEKPQQSHGKIHEHAWMDRGLYTANAAEY
jgi:hypothetical protein